jgi:hypothetical protein
MTTFHCTTSTVYHDHPACPIGQLVPVGSRHPGAADKRRCDWCEQIGQQRSGGAGGTPNDVTLSLTDGSRN